MLIHWRNILRAGPTAAVSIFIIRPYKAWFIVFSFISAL